MKAIHKKRLLKLADFLSKLPESKFNLSVITDDLDKPTVEKSCKIAACAMGWCPIVFPRLMRYFHRQTSDHLEVCLKDNKRRRTENYSAVKHIFGLNGDQSSYLFSPLEYHYDKSGVKNVVKRIRKFVKKDGEMTENTNRWGF